MPPSGKERHFAVLRTALALAEERGSVSLDEAAAQAGVDRDELHSLLEPVLYLEFRTASNELVGEERAFLLNPDDHLQVSEHHWLRDLAADPPAPDAALRLLVAALAYQAFVPLPPDLEDAVKKLRGIVATQLHVPVDNPPFLPTVQAAWRDGRSLAVRYLAEAAEVAHQFEILPHRVFCKWGHWYVLGRIPGEAEPRAFRVDRMQSADLGAAHFEPPDDVEVPEWFDLSALERTVRVRAPRAALDVLPQPHTTSDMVELPDGNLEMDLTVAGDRRLEHLLVCLPPEAEVIEPAEYRELRRRHAGALLDLYD
jgi:predicted DNA-binding transcriptional regulator YafY